MSKKLFISWGLPPQGVNNHSAIPLGVDVSMICGNSRYKISDRTHNYIQKEVVIMINNKMDAEIKIRCSKSEKELLKKSVEEIGISMSDFVRPLIFGKEKIVLISEGADIAKALFLIHNDLEYFRNNGGVPEESARAITEALNDVSTQLVAVSEKLTDIHTDFEEADSNE